MKQTYSPLREAMMPVYRLCPSPLQRAAKGKMYPDDSAFTLIEVLISLTLLTIVLGTVYSSFFSVQSAVSRFDNVSLKYHEARTALDIMRREIEGAIVKNPRSEDDNKIKAAFVVKDRDVFGKHTSSLTLTSFSFRGSKLNAVSYFVKDSEGALDLLKTEGPAAIPSKTYNVEIIEGIEGFTVEVLFNNRWVKTWDTANTDKLPDKVRISIAFDDNGNGVTLTEYATPRIGTQL